MGFWDVVTGRSSPKPAQLDALFAVPTAAITLETDARAAADRRGLGLLPGRRRAGVPADPGRRGRAARRRPGCAAGRGDQRRVRLHLAAQPARPGRRRRSRAPTCTRSTRPSRPQGFGPGLLCSLVAVRRRSGPPGRPGLPLQAGARSTRSRRSPAAAGCATTCSRSRSATRSPASSRWSRTSAAGSRSGARRDSDADPVSVSPCGTCPAARASARGRPGPTARSPGRPRSG